MEEYRHTCGINKIDAVMQCMSNLFTAHGQNIACGPMSPAEGDEVTAAATGGSTL